jgi:hypothetical protein
VVIMLAIGTAAGAASFTHVHDLAAAHRQGGWLAWVDAIVLELMSIASGLEIRRRRRVRGRLAMPATVLGCAVGLSLTAQVVQAEPSPIGWTAAAVPAIGFLTMVKIALGYHPTTTVESGAVPSAADRTAPSPPSRTAPTPPPAGDSALPDVLVRDRAGDTDDITALLPAARRIAARLSAAGQPLTRGSLAAALRAEGYACLL